MKYYKITIKFQKNDVPLNCSVSLELAPEDVFSKAFELAEIFKSQEPRFGFFNGIDIKEIPSNLILRCL